MELSDHSQLVKPMSWKSSVWEGEELPSQGHTALGALRFHTDHRPLGVNASSETLPSSLNQNLVQTDSPHLVFLLFHTCFFPENKLWLLVADY